MWIITSKSLLSKLEDIRKRALKFVLDDYVSKYCELLIKTDVSDKKIMALGYLAIEVWKCMYELKTKYLNDLFTIKKFNYVLRDGYLLNRSKVLTTNTVWNHSKTTGLKCGIYWPGLVKELFS